MNWTNLKKNKCPHCGKDLVGAFRPGQNMFVCKCGFKIKPDTFKKLTGKIVSKEIGEDKKDD